MKDRIEEAISLVEADIVKERTAKHLYLTAYHSHMPLTAEQLFYLEGTEYWEKYAVLAKKYGWKLAVAKPEGYDEQEKIRSARRDKRVAREQKFTAETAAGEKEIRSALLRKISNYKEIKRVEFDSYLIDLRQRRIEPKFYPNKGWVAKSAPDLGVFATTTHREINPPESAVRVTLNYNIAETPRFKFWAEPFNTADELADAVLKNVSMAFQRK